MRILRITLLSLTACSVFVCAPALYSGSGLEARTDPGQRRKQLRLLASAPARYRRSRNAPTKRRLKPNRLTIGKRVRRKHRRAA